MRLTIHQPEHLPWLGFFDKAAQADIFVLLDTVQYRKNYFHNRNRIKGTDHPVWLTLPVRKPVLAPIREIRVDGGRKARGKVLNLIRACCDHAPYFDTYVHGLEQILMTDSDVLSEINTELIRFALDALGIKTELIIASSLDLPPAKGGTEVNLSLSRHLGASTYLSGISGREYLSVAPFEASGIVVEFQEFYHPIYDQLHGPFEPCMSIVDLLFNHGEGSRDILLGSSVERIDTLFA